MEEQSRVAGPAAETDPATAVETLPRARRLVDALIGAICGALAGALGAVLAPPQGLPVAPIAAALAVVAGALGYRWGRGIAIVVWDAFSGTTGD